MSEYVLEVQDVTKTFPGVKALDSVSLNVRPGSVHALMGENGAGKSTLMKCLFGIYRPDGGTIKIDGEPVQIDSPSQALDLGISMIHQEAHPIRFRPVMENVWLGRFPMKGGVVVDHKAMYEKTVELFKKVDLDVDPRVEAGKLTSSTLQLMEIARAVSYNAKVVIMDEPTSSLTDNETAHLFEIIRRLKEEGRSVIYISHKMEEILAIADEVTIMRDGQKVGCWPASELTTDLIISRMVGRDMNHRFPPRQGRPSEDVILRVRDLCGGDRSFKNVSFDLRRGEILGIGGLVGAKRTDLAEALFGLRPIIGGTVEKGGKELHIRHPRDAKENGIALLTEERRANGIFGVLPVLDNTVVANQAEYATFGVLNERQRFEAANRACSDLNVKTPTLSTWIQNLSGGNQQKVLVGRWLLTDSDILILDEPTRGIDVGAKYEIYSIMLEQLKAGKSIIMISSEMPELLGMSDRVMVMCRGEVTGILEREQFDQVEVMRLATALLR